MSNTYTNYTNYLNNQNINTGFSNQNNSVFSNQNSNTNNSSSNSNSYYYSYSNSTLAQARSLWIGDIDNWMDEGFMIKIFQEVANVKNIKIIRDKAKGTSLGYGFVEFENPEIAKDVLNTLNGKLIPESNKTLKLNWASYSAGKQALMNGNQGIIDYSIYVGDLDLSVTEEILKEYFCKYYNSVIGVKVIIDPINKNSKGYGFVKFSEQSEANRALTEMNGKILNGKGIKTNQASFKKITAELNSVNNQPNYNPNICNTQSPYAVFSNFANNFNSPDVPSLNYNSNNSSYTDFIPNTSTSIPSKSKNSFQSSNAVTNLRNNPAPFFKNNTSDTSNQPNINLLNLNNFYIHNPNMDYTSDMYTAGSNYNLNNFYYNNCSQNKSKPYIFNNKAGINSTNINYINNYNNNYFNYMNNIPDHQQQLYQNNNSSGFMYNYGNFSNTNMNYSNKMPNNLNSIINVTNVNSAVSSDEKGNNLT